MLINANDAEYITRAINALQNGETDAMRHAQNYCPECDENINAYAVNADAHILTNIEGKQYLLIGCEGYWIINPNYLGMPRDNWTDYREEF